MECEGGMGGVQVIVRGRVNRLLHSHRLAVKATRDYANKCVTRLVAHITNDSSCFYKKIISCDGRIGRRILNISRSDLTRCKTIDHPIIRRVTLKTVHILNYSYTITASNVTNPNKNAPRGPIKAI